MILLEQRPSISIPNSPLALYLVRHFGLFLTAVGLVHFSSRAQDLKLHPENPHYFLWRGKPTILITSGEHYGAVLNRDLDYVTYLDTLAADGLNLTRTFTGGAYYEPQGVFNIANNTLAPAPNRFLAPWARSDTPGFAGGGNKFDLTRWSDLYFQRLRDFVQQASRRGIVVEMNLFCPFYDEIQWKLSPFNAANNVNGVGQLSRTNVYTLDQNGGLLPFQENLVEKVVEKLADFDNVYFEICNEPYFGGVTLPWQQHIADVITRVPSQTKRPKLISQNIANQSARIEKPLANVSIFNFHYATPPDAVGLNYHLNRVMGDNETGFRGTNNAAYRTEGWEFVLAGGGLYNNLDYSFTVGHEDGTFVYPASQPGGGNAVLRKQLRILRDFINGFDFVHMEPGNKSVKSAEPGGVETRALVQPGRAYAVYARLPKADSARSIFLSIELPAGAYRSEWIDTKEGGVAASEDWVHQSGSRKMNSPQFSEDIALRIIARQP
jgi:hypothetical protein